MNRRCQTFTPANIPLLRLAIPGFATVTDRRALTLGLDLALDVGLDLLDDSTPYGHDTWTLFVAIALGSTVFLPDVLVSYRQHDTNVYSAPHHISAGQRARSFCSRSPITLRGLLERSAADRAFRHRALTRLAEITGDPTVANVARRWRKAAERQERRLALYGDSTPFDRAPRRARNVLRGDYGRRAVGGHGAAALVRDATYLWA